MKPRLTLVGAGPGDPELISMKGIKALASADVVLYDALVHPDLLHHCNDDTLKVFVGKRAGVHSFQQEKINEMIVEHALNRGHVVRLKGGDPFIFGRGKEELDYAGTFGIETAVIPGISSINLPGYYGMSLTRRGINESFWVITAVTSNGELSSDLKLASQTNATVVVLMGLKRIKQIVNIFKRANKDELPVAVIYRGSWQDGKVLMGSIKNIEQKVSRARYETPALIVMGEAVGPDPKFYQQAENLRQKYLTV